MEKKKKLLLILLLFAIPFTNYSREWKSPDSDMKTYRAGEKVTIHRTNNSLDRYHHARIFLTGIDHNGQPRANYKVFDETLEGDCGSFGGTKFYYTLPCNLSANNYRIYIVHKRRRDICIFGNWINSGNSTRNFLVNPLLINAPVTEVHNACTDENYTITLGNPDGYDGANWYHSITDATPFYGSLSYTQKYQALLTTHYIKYYKQDGACQTESAPGLISVNTLPINGLIPPKTQFKTYCEKGNYRIDLENLNNYSGALWYDEFNAPIPMHDGLYFQRFFNDGTRMLYVKYYDDSHGCRVYSERTPIQVTVLTKPTVSVEVDGVNSFEIYDHRDVPGASCFDANLFYHDLNDGIDHQQLRDDAQTYTDALVATINNESPFTEIRNSTLSHYRWTPSDYYRMGAELRVCADNITNAQGEYRKKQYDYVATFDFIAEIRDPEGNVLAQEPRSCTFIITKKWIANVPPGAVLPTETCNPPSVETMQNLLNDQLKDNCTSAEVITICPDETVTLGPPGPELALVTYSWSPATGLSKPNSKNPTIHYDNLPISPSQIMKYKLSVNTGLVETQQACYYIYKCANCGPAEVILHELLNSTN
jgi:hypothetical protein